MMSVCLVGSQLPFADGLAKKGTHTIHQPTPAAAPQIQRDARLGLKQPNNCIAYSLKQSSTKLASVDEKGKQSSIVVWKGAECGAAAPTRCSWFAPGGRKE